MNIKANKIISEIPEVNSIAIFPSCGDESNPLGAVWASYYEKSQDNVFHGLKHYYLGPDFSDEKSEKIIKAFQSENNFTYKKIKDINKKIAGLLAKGEIVARCTGKM